MNNPAAPALEALRPEFPLGIAYSGGADSSVLLRAAAKTWPGHVVALHVHHGLQAAAGDFVRHCEGVCAELGVPLHVSRVQAAHASGESPEDAARKARYTALAQLCKEHAIRNVALAQHADDQVETMLLALSRGAGVPGLAAMPERFERHGVTFLRPLLGVSALAIRNWLRESGHGFIDDPSNADTAFTRNKIRHTLLPALGQAFPQFRETFGRSARNAAQAQELLEELAARDLQDTGNPPRIEPLRQLARARQANALRHWLRSAHGLAPSAAQLEELLDQLEACSTRGHRIDIKVANGFLRREGEALAWYNR